MQISQDNITIAKTVASAIGIEPHVYPYWDDDKKNSIDILNCTDPLDREIMLYCTIGVSDQPVSIDDKDQDFGIELLMGGKKDLEKIPNILSTCGFYILKNNWECTPGSVFKRIVEMYYPGLEMKHIYFTMPFLWEDKLETLQLNEKKVSWLLGVPISDAELEYKLKHGTDALEEVFEEKQVNPLNLLRDSSI